MSLLHRIWDIFLVSSFIVGVIVIVLGALSEFRDF